MYKTRSWIILIILMISMGWIGFHYAHFITEGINYVAAWGQAQLLTEPIMPPIPGLPAWAHIFMGIIVALVMEDTYTRAKLNIKRRLFHKRSHSD